jgi:hypothetical protein
MNDHKSFSKLRPWELEIMDDEAYGDNKRPGSRSNRSSCGRDSASEADHYQHWDLYADIVFNPGGKSLVRSEHDREQSMHIMKQSKPVPMSRKDEVSAPPSRLTESLKTVLPVTSNGISKSEPGGMKNVSSALPALTAPDLMKSSLKLASTKPSLIRPYLPSVPAKTADFAKAAVVTKSGGYAEHVEAKSSSPVKLTKISGTKIKSPGVLATHLPAAKSETIESIKLLPLTVNSVPVETVAKHSSKSMLKRPVESSEPVTSVNKVKLEHSNSISSKKKAEISVQAPLVKVKAEKCLKPESEKSARDKKLSNPVLLTKTMEAASLLKTTEASLTKTTKTTKVLATTEPVSAVKAPLTVNSVPVVAAGTDTNVLKERAESSEPVLLVSKGELEHSNFMLSKRTEERSGLTPSIHVKTEKSLKPEKSSREKSSSNSISLTETKNASLTKMTESSKVVTSTKVVLPVKLVPSLNESPKFGQSIKTTQTLKHEVQITTEEPPSCTTRIQKVSLSTKIAESDTSAKTMESFKSKKKKATEYSQPERTVKSIKSVSSEKASEHYQSTSSTKMSEPLKPVVPLMSPDMKPPAESIMSLNREPSAKMCELSKPLLMPMKVSKSSKSDPSTGLSASLGQANTRELLKSVGSSLTEAKHSKDAAICTKTLTKISLPSDAKVKSELKTRKEISEIKKPAQSTAKLSDQNQKLLTTTVKASQPVLFIKPEESTSLERTSMPSAVKIIEPSESSNVESLLVESSSLPSLLQPFGIALASSFEAEQLREITKPAESLVPPAIPSEVWTTITKLSELLAKSSDLSLFGSSGICLQSILTQKSEPLEPAALAKLESLELDAELLGADAPDGIIPAVREGSVSPYNCAFNNCSSSNDQQPDVKTLQEDNAMDIAYYSEPTALKPASSKSVAVCHMASDNFEAEKMKKSPDLLNSVAENMFANSASSVNLFRGCTGEDSAIEYDDDDELNDPYNQLDDKNDKCISDPIITGENAAFDYTSDGTAEFPCSIDGFIHPCIDFEKLVPVVNIGSVIETSSHERDNIMQEMLFGKESVRTIEDFLIKTTTLLAEENATMLEPSIQDINIDKPLDCEDTDTSLTEENQHNAKVLSEESIVELNTSPVNKDAESVTSDACTDAIKMPVPPAEDNDGIFVDEALFIEQNNDDKTRVSSDYEEEDINDETEESLHNESADESETSFIDEAETVTEGLECIESINLLMAEIPPVDEEDNDTECLTNNKSITASIAETLPVDDCNNVMEGLVCDGSITKAMAETLFEGDKSEALACDKSSTIPMTERALVDEGLVGAESITAHIAETSIVNEINNVTGCWACDKNNVSKILVNESYDECLSHGKSATESVAETSLVDKSINVLETASAVENNDEPQTLILEADTVVNASASQISLVGPQVNIVLPTLCDEKLSVNSKISLNEEGGEPGARDRHIVDPQTSLYETQSEENCCIPQTLTCTSCEAVETQEEKSASALLGPVDYDCSPRSNSDSRSRFRSVSKSRSRSNSRSSSHVDSTSESSSDSDSDSSESSTTSASSQRSSSTVSSRSEKVGSGGRRTSDENDEPLPPGVDSAQPTDGVKKNMKLDANSQEAIVEKSKDNKISKHADIKLEKSIELNTLEIVDLPVSKQTQTKGGVSFVLPKPVTVAPKPVVLYRTGVKRQNVDGDGNDEKCKKSTLHQVLSITRGLAMQEKELAYGDKPDGIPRSECGSTINQPMSISTGPVQEKRRLANEVEPPNGAPRNKCDRNKFGGNISCSSESENIDNSEKQRKLALINTFR